MIRAVLSVQIDHRRGPWVANSDHVLTWLVADGTVPVGVPGGFDFLVCSIDDPDDCRHDGPDDVVATYQVTFSSVGRPDRAVPSKDG